jgi:hypothetical protein
MFLVISLQMLHHRELSSIKKPKVNFLIIGNCISNNFCINPFLPPTLWYVYIKYWGLLGGLMKRKFLTHKQSQMVTLVLLIISILSYWTSFQGRIMAWVGALLLLVSLITVEPSALEKSNATRHSKLARKILLIMFLLFVTKIIIFDTAIAWYISQPPQASIKINNHKTGYVLGNYLWKENDSGTVSIYHSGTAESLKVQQPLKLSVLFKKEHPQRIEVGTWDYIENDLTPMQEVEKFPISLSEELWENELLVIRAYWDEDFVEYIVRLNVEDK